MRKGMWKKGLTVAMAAAMLAGPVSVPAVFNNGVAVVKADETNKGQDVYVLMNIPYADFYKAELNNTVKVDATTSATKTKTKSTLANGSYHADNTGEHISGITYPVKIKAGTDLSKLTKITDASKVSITVNMKGKETTTEYKGKDALFESADYSYYELGTTAPAYYKELTVNENGSYSFGKTTATEKTVKGAAIEKFKTSSKYGDYQLNLNFDKVADSDQISGNTKVLAAVITTTDGTQYGLRHVENIWKGTEFAWGTGFTTQSHGCPISGEHYVSMMGKTIDVVTYYTENGVVKYDIDDTYVPYKSDTTATKPSATTTATKPAATTTATKPAVKPVKKVTVKKQTAKVKAGKKKLTVTWKKDKNVSGYQIKIATKKNFKGAKTYTVKSYKTYKKVIKKLKAKKKYFVKVRAYKTVGKSKVYGAYSAVRSCKVK